MKFPERAKYDRELMNAKLSDYRTLSKQFSNTGDSYLPGLNFSAVIKSTRLLKIRRKLQIIQKQYKRESHRKKKKPRNTSEFSQLEDDDRASPFAVGITSLCHEPEREAAHWRALRYSRERAS